MIEILRQIAATLNPVEFWLICAALAAVAAVVLRKGLDGFWRLRTVTDTPTAKVRSTPQGYVELSGRALPHSNHVQATLTGLPCVWYRFKIEQRRRTGKTSHWVAVEEGEANAPFLLDDGTGRCLVEPSDAELHCHAKDTWYGSHRRAPKPQGRGWHNLGGRYRLTEERILDGDPIYLLGRFETLQRGPKEKERLARGLLSTWKRDPERISTFDEDGDGDISLAEWEGARAKAQRIAELSEARMRSEPPLSRVVSTDDARRPFVIATLDPDSLLRRLRLRAYGGTALFLLAASLVSFAVVTRLLQD